MNHKERMRTPKKGSKARKTWGNLNPVTKIVQSDKKYKRSKEKKFMKEYYGCEG